MKIIYNNENYELNVPAAIKTKLMVKEIDHRFFVGGVYRWLKNSGSKERIVILQTEWNENKYALYGLWDKFDMFYTNAGKTKDQLEKDLEDYELVGVLPNLSKIKLNPPPAN